MFRATSLEAGSKNRSNEGIVISLVMNGSFNMHRNDVVRVTEINNLERIIAKECFHPDINEEASLEYLLYSEDIFAWSL